MFHYIKGGKDFAKLLLKEKNLLLNTLVIKGVCAPAESRRENGL